jgi:hypothetical protein
MADQGLLTASAAMPLGGGIVATCQSTTYRRDGNLFDSL